MTTKPPLLKSTYKSSAEPPPLQSGWTQHRAPDGRPYYYNETTKQSTYIRPSNDSCLVEPPSNRSFGRAPDQDREAYIPAHSSLPQRGTPDFTPFSNQAIERNSHYPDNTDGRGDQVSRSYHHRPQPKDRPKKKASIPGCIPWLLVQTKLGRRFVHNPETKESLWKFPPDVLRAVIEYDRLEREKRTGNGDLTVETKGKEHAATEATEIAVRDEAPIISASPAPVISGPVQNMADDIEDEYEEVEVTDNEDDTNHSKRQKTDKGDVDQPVEFNEDDIAYQLAAMGEDYGLDPGEYGNVEGEELEEGAQGLDLTEEDSKALFKDLLSDYQISPYIPWEKIIESGLIIEDDRYTVLPNMRSRKEVWDEWSRDTIQRLKEQREKEEKKDPRIPYYVFLQAYATPKLYWPEFKRKYRKEPELSNTKISDKDREKWYRDYIGRVKLAETTLKADLIKMLQSTPLSTLNRSTKIDSLSPSLLTDMRYISVRKGVRDPLIETHISTLPPPQTNEALNERDLQVREDRERRERALAERQAQVQEEKRRQRGALQYSKGMLQEGEEELQKAMKVGKEGLLGHLNRDNSL